MTERTYQINDRLELASQEATKFDEKDMVCEVIFRALNDVATVEFKLDQRSMKEKSLTPETVHKLNRGLDGDHCSRDYRRIKEK